MNPWRAEWRIMSGPMWMTCAGMCIATAACVRDWSKMDNYSAGIVNLPHSSWTLMVSLAAMALASIQGLADGDLDQRALGRMRAISDGRQYLCKCMVGLSAYAISVGLPLMLACIWSAWLIPRPFLPGMLIHPLLIMAAGVLCYFGVQCAFLSTGRWLQRATYPLAACVMAVVITGHYAGSEEWTVALTFPRALEELTWLLITLAVLLHSSWHLFRHQGDTHGDGTLLVIGPAGLMAVAVFPLIFWVQMVFGLPLPNINVVGYRMGADGGVAVGGPDGKSDPLDPANQYDRMLAARDDGDLDCTISSPFEPEADDDFHSYCGMSGSFDFGPIHTPLVYYAIPSRHQIRVLDWETGRPAAVPVPAGFPPFPDRFERSLTTSGQTYIATDGRPWHLEGSLIVTVKGPWTHGMPLSVECREGLDRNDKIDVTKSWMMVLTPTQILKYDFTGELIQERRLPFSLSEAGPLHVSVGDWFRIHFDWNPNHQITLEHSSSELSHEVIALWIDAKGAILCHRQLTRFTNLPASRLRHINTVMQPPLLGPDPLMPVSWNTWYTRTPRGSEARKSAEAFSLSRSLHGHEWVGQAVVALFCGALLAICAFRRTRQWSLCLAWLIFGALFGAGSLVGYAIHRPASWQAGRGRNGGTASAPTDRSSPSVRDPRSDIQITDEAA